MGQTKLFRDYLLEIGAEELPSSAVYLAIGQLEERARRLLAESRLVCEDLSVYGGPRRLALYIRGLADRQEDFAREVKGPPKKAAFAPDGTPTPAALGFARSQGVDPSELHVMEADGGEYVFARYVEKGLPVREVLAREMPGLIKSLSFPKTMHWDRGDLRFPRPLRWVVSLLGEEEIPFDLEGLTAGRRTRGHRFLANIGDLSLTSAADYLEILDRSAVVADQSRRRALIEERIREAAASQGYRAAINPAVLDEVVNLVEHPESVCGTFDPAFLILPREVLVSAMESHQRYFPVEAEDGSLAAGFVAVHNGDRAAGEIIRRGNQRVLAARLADARFFYLEDQKIPLEDLVNRLGGVTFHQKLGSTLRKVDRTVRMTEVLADRLGANPDEKRQALRAARLCKADLLTHMVVEFPNLQGIMGRQYARHFGEPAEVAEAIYEHYLPRFAGDDLPGSRAGQLVSLADKLDSVISFFAVGISPTGSMDPYALRRQAAGVISILRQRGEHLHLIPVFREGIKLLDEQQVSRRGEEEVIRELLEFFQGRLRRQLLQEGARFDIIDAVLAGEVEDDPVALADRTLALAQVTGSSIPADILTAYQRCRNLGRAELGTDVVASDLSEPVEAELLDVLSSTEEAFSRAMGERDYAIALQELAGLRPIIDRFFEEVLVMAEDEKVRQARLKLLNKAVGLYHRYADFKLVVGEAL